MLIFTTHNFFSFTRKEIWFYAGEEFEEGLYNVFSSAKHSYRSSYLFHEKYNTSVLDLSKSETELYNNIHSTFRYDIRNAEKKRISTQLYFNPDKKDCLKLINNYNLFAHKKGLQKMNFKWVMALQKKGNICFSKVFLNHTEIATHVYIFDKETISLSSSFHNIEFKDDKLRSASNKLLHWKDILSFKEKGFKYYDFGGINPQKLPGVSKFKTSFGGQTIESFRFIKTNVFIYTIITILKNLRSKWIRT